LPSITDSRHRAVPDGGFAGLHETHAAVVFLVGDQAYKLKKPVNLGFLDFTDRSTRQAVCRREVELNRRLAPDVYLGVADVRGPDGSVCDHLVVMRRMPASRRLAALVRAGAPVADPWPQATTIATDTPPGRLGRARRRRGTRRSGRAPVRRRLCSLQACFTGPNLQGRTYRAESPDFPGPVPAAVTDAGSQ
jgi:hypothetical protein